MLWVEPKMTMILNSHDVPFSLQVLHHLFDGHVTFLSLLQIFVFQYAHQYAF